eukprot:2764731-Amphidinium_carterae.1
MICHDCLRGGHEVLGFPTCSGSDKARLSDCPSHDDIAPQRKLVYQVVASGHPMQRNSVEGPYVLDTAFKPSEQRRVQ